MSKKQGFNFGGQPIPTAPAPNEFTHSETFQPRAPPPSYEESQKIMNFNHLQQHQQAIPTYPPPNYGIATAATSYQGTLPQYRSPQRTYTAVTTTQIKSSIPKVVEFDSGARFKGKGAGSLMVPPPPPGYAPTPAQIAALQGQPVILQKKKKSLF